VTAIRNFIIRLSITYIVFSVLLLLPGIDIVDGLFTIWISAVTFTILTVVVRPVILALTLPFIIFSGGLFIFIVDGIVLVMTAALSGLQVASFWGALLGIIVIANVNIWVQGAFRKIGWLEDDNGDEENIVTSQSPKFWLRILLILVLISGILFSADMARQAFIAISILTTDIRLIGMLSGIIFLALVLGVSWLVAEGLALSRRAIFSTFVTIIAGGAGIGIAYLSLVSQVALPDKEPQPRESTDYWNLSTGSRIAYTHIPSQGLETQNPILFLHGGPGRSTLDEDIAFFSRFADAGYDVYLYDQVGSGLSERLDRIGYYSIARNVADLEAIRETLNADRLILIGHAEGSELAIHYLSHHPDRVERVTLISPTPLWKDDALFFDYSRTAAFTVFQTIESRYQVAEQLAIYSPRTAEKVVGQQELSSWMDAQFDEGIFVCSEQADEAPDPVAPGYNYYSQVRVNVTINQNPIDPRDLDDNITPVIVLRAECDFSPWEAVLQYEDTLPNNQMFYFDDAGSMIYLTQPDQVEATINAFLSDAAFPVEPYIDRKNPDQSLLNIRIPLPRR